MRALAHAALGALALALALSAAPAPASGFLARQVCTLPPATWMLYASGLSPSSALSARCERCIASFAIARLNQTKPGDAFAFYDDSERSCLALYLAGTLGMRAMCRDCENEVAAIEDAFEGRDQCSEPMAGAITRAASGCDRIALTTFPFGGTLARITCKLLVSDVLGVFQKDAPEDSPCVQEMRNARQEGEKAVSQLPDNVTVATVLGNRVVRDFVVVDDLVSRDMDQAAVLTPCYSSKPYSLADRDPGPFCACLTRDSTPTSPSDEVAAAQRVFQATDLATFGVRSLILESIRVVLIDVAKCFDLDDNAFLVRAKPKVIASPTPTPSPSPASKRFNAFDPDPSCFPGDAMLVLEDGRSVAMRNLKLGDRVQVAPGTFSDVFLFTHRSPHALTHFVNIRTASGHTLRASPGHYVHVNGRLRAAAAVREGDSLSLASGAPTRVSHVSAVAARGLYNPQTLHGDVVVDGVVASTYTTAVEPRLARQGLLLARWLYQLLPLRALRPVFESVFADGSPRLAALLPSGHPSLGLEL